jgi:hypothetical protein
MADKGQGLPITTIIIAAMGIIVLIVLIAIFSSQVGVIGSASKECSPDFKCVPSVTVTQIKQNVAIGECGDGFTSVGRRLEPGQPSKQIRSDDARFCNPCCAPAG